MRGRSELKQEKKGTEKKGRGAMKKEEQGEMRW